MKKHAYAFTALCATDFALGAFQPASMIASACFLTALNSVYSSSNDAGSSSATTTKQIALVIAELIGADVDSLWNVREHVEDLFKRTTTSMTQEITNFDSPKSLNQDFEFIHEDDLFQFDDDGNYLDDERCTYDELIRGFETESSSSNDNKDINSKHQQHHNQLKFFGGFNVTSDSLFDCINELNLNDYDDYVSVKKTTNNNMNNTKKSKKSESNRSSVSSNSSGVSSMGGGAASSSSACSSQNTHNYLSYLNKSNCFQLTPPMANLLPMPTFDDDDTVTKKKTVNGERSRRNSSRNRSRKQKLVLF